ncbi:ATP-dependent zinc metalloprotease FtsH [Streptomyces californicus]
MAHQRDYSEEVAALVDEEVKKLIETAHNEAWETRDVLDNLVLGLLERETLGKEEIAEIFAPIVKRPAAGPRVDRFPSRRTPSTRFSAGPPPRVLAPTKRAGARRRSPPPRAPRRNPPRRPSGPRRTAPRADPELPAGPAGAG